MFERWSYAGYTLLFCLPPLILLWLRKEFFEILLGRLRAIVLATMIITFYGCAIWPVAIRHGAWAYRDDRILGWKLFGYVYVDDVIWWALVSFLISSFVALSSEYERQKIDVVSREIRGFLRSLGYAFRGLRAIRLERNSTIHVAAAAFVILEGVLFRISGLEWMLVALSIGAVLGFELLNSAVERVASRTARGADWGGAADHRLSGDSGSFGGYGPSADGAASGERRSPEIGVIKDAAAAGVLLSAAAAAAVGLGIFFHRVLQAVV